MSAKPKPDRPSSTAPATRYRGLSAEDLALLERLERKGLIGSAGPDFGKPLAEDDPILQPGPACPGAVDSFIADRRSGL